MSIDWEQVTLADVSEDVAYGYTESASKRKVGPHFLRITDIQDGTVDWTTVPYCPINNSDLEKYRLSRGDIVVARTGNSTGENFLFDSDREAVFASYLIRFRADPARAIPAFVWYSMRAPAWWAFVSGAKTGSAQAGANAKVLGGFTIRLPDLEEQRAIANVLGALDDKIEQNRRTSAKLEELARAVFRAWFVDFAPVHAKAAGATTFPGMPQDAFDSLPTGFEESEIGPVPEGWKAMAATDLANVAIGKTPPRKESKWFSTSPTDIRWVSIANMKDCGAFVTDTTEYLTEEAVEKHRVRRIPDRSVLFSFKLTVGRVAITDGEMTSNEAIAHFVPKHPDAVGAEFLYCYLTLFDSGRLGSTSSIATATNSRAVKAMPILNPTQSIAAFFTSTIRPLFQMIRQLQHESRKLAELRDYLLPKLLSGEVRVRQAERALGEAV